MKAVATAQRLVIKVGSSLVTNEGRGLDHAAVARWAEEIAALRRESKARQERITSETGGPVEGGPERPPHY